MDSRKDADFNKESAEVVSNDSTLNTVSAVPVEQEDDKPDFNTSCPAILDPSEDDPLFKREKIRRPFKTYRAIMQSYNSTDILVDSEEPPNEWEVERQAGGCPSVCVDLFNRYKDFAVAFRNSNFIYIIQIWLVLLSFTTIMMGNTYASSCPGSPNLITVTVLTALFAVILVFQWMALGCCSADDRPCEGQQKFGILFFFILVSAMLELEIYLYSQLSPSFDPSAANYCHQVFYDFTYYKFFAAFGSALVVVLLYFPGCSSLASGVVCSDPITATCYNRYTDEED